MSKRARFINDSGELDTDYVQFREYPTGTASTGGPVISPKVGTLWFEKEALASLRSAFRYQEDESTIRGIPDYHYGTFQPNLRYGTTDITLTDADGTYVRTGGVVTVTCHIVWTMDITAGTTQNLNVDNMPFAKNAAISTLSMPVGAVQQFTTAAGYSMGLRFVDSSTQVNFFWNNISGGNIANVQAGESDATGTKVLGFSVTYPIAPLT